MNNRYTLPEVRILNMSAGFLFFSRENMKHAGDTMANFGITHIKETGQVFIRRKNRTSKGFNPRVWQFNTETFALRVVDND